MNIFWSQQSYLCVCHQNLWPRLQQKPLKDLPASILVSLIYHPTVSVPLKIKIKNSWILDRHPHCTLEYNPTSLSWPIICSPQHLSGLTFLPFTLASAVLSVCPAVCASRPSYVSLFPLTGMPFSNIPWLAPSLYSDIPFSEKSPFSVKPSSFHHFLSSYPAVFFFIVCIILFLFYIIY